MADTPAWRSRTRRDEARAAAPRRAAAVALVLGLGAAATTASAGDAVFEITRQQLEQQRAELSELDHPLARVERLLATGSPDAAAELLPELTEHGSEGRRLAVRVLLELRDYAAARPLLEALELDAPLDRELWYEWLFTIDDLAAVDELSCRWLARGETVVDELAAGRLRLALLNPTQAEQHHSRALELAELPRHAAAARRGLAAVAFKRQDFDLAHQQLQAAFELTPTEPELLYDLGRTLIRLGSTDEAIAAFELAVELAPYHEGAHYMLGNGYARKSYTQLYAAYPDAFADAAGRERLAAADRRLAAGDSKAARAAYQALRDQHPRWADVPTRLGSLAFAHGHYRRARELFQASLASCPEYGRAHNGLAKTLEAERLAVEVHRPGYEAALAAAEMPRIERIDELVLNWHALSPRHQKRVAMSVAPWRRYLPVLIAGGYSYYIKPLYELLSETPGQETLRDLRISYDSRLWDDVRGCGGYHTVTGIEDVERTVLGRYDTVLHELTHQVHGVLPSPTSRRIQELYRETKQRGVEAFLSRYAGGSVWEYFAEGANALASPRRDDYDTREIVRERLDDLDPTLRDLVVELMHTAGVEDCYPVAYVGRGDQELEHARPAAAIESYRKALEHDPGEPTALAALIHALQLAGEPQQALQVAERAVSKLPQEGDLATARAGAQWHAGRGLRVALAALETARAEVRAADRYRVDLVLGRLHWVAGDAERSLAAFRRVLDYQADNPEGLRGKAEALALARRWDEAWPVFQQAVRLRTGVIGLRAAYARDLLRAGRLADAREQIDAALLLDPEEPRVRALEAWWQLASGRAEQALAVASTTLEQFPWCTLARIVEARASQLLGEPEQAADLLAPLRERLAVAAPPRYVFRDKWGRYERVEAHPAVERQLLKAWFTGSP